jgi:hypothetical protein
MNILHFTPEARLEILIHWHFFAQLPSVSTIIFSDAVSKIKRQPGWNFKRKHEMELQYSNDLLGPSTVLSDKASPQIVAIAVLRVQVLVISTLFIT